MALLLEAKILNVFSTKGYTDKTSGEVTPPGWKVQMFYKMPAGKEGTEEKFVSNKYETEYAPVPAVPATVTSPEIPATSKEVVTKVTRVTGKLDVYALPADPRNGIPPLVDGHEYSCAYSNATGSPLPEAQLYTHLMTLPEFAGCVAA